MYSPLTEKVGKLPWANGKRCVASKRTTYEMAAAGNEEGVDILGKFDITVERNLLFELKVTKTN